VKEELRIKLKRRSFLKRMLRVSKVEAFLRTNFQQVLAYVCTHARDKKRKKSKKRDK
jgi:hypothetical protein